MKNIYTFAAQPAQRTVTIPCMREAKREGRKLIQTTANTAEEARAVEAANLDMMICDSVNAHIVREANKTTFCTAAVKFTEHPTVDDIMREAFRVLNLGVDAIITPRSFKTIEKLTREGIPVMGHLGLVPRKSISIGGLRAIGKTADEAMELYKDYKRLEDVGAFSAESEVIAGPVMTEIAKRTKIICVSLGSGNGGDVSFLFMNDLCGETEDAPRHARAFGNLRAKYDELHQERIAALGAFKTASLEGSFPSSKETPAMQESELNAFKNARKNLNNTHKEMKMAENIRVCGIDDIEEEDVMRFDNGDKTYAIFRAPDGNFYATDGYCTHEKAHLGDGIVDEFEIECPLHFGAFDYRTGDPTVAPACVKLKTYPVTIEGDSVFINVN